MSVILLNYCLGYIQSPNWLRTLEISLKFLPKGLISTITSMLSFLIIRSGKLGRRGKVFPMAWFTLVTQCQNGKVTQMQKTLTLMFMSPV